MTKRTAMPLSVLLAGALPAAGQLDYRVDVTRPGTQVIRVEATATNLDGETIDFALPTWRSGKYVVLDFASTVRDVRALGAAGVPLPVRKTNKSTWRVLTGGLDEVTLSYDVFADSLNDRTRYLDGEHCFFDASAVLMYAPGRRDGDHTVRVDAPEGWTVVTGLDGRLGGGWASPTYDVLADSPFDMGSSIELLRFEAGGVPHEIAVWTEADYDRARLVSDFKIIADEQIRLFGGAPYERYVFMLHAQPGLGGGTEHLNSTIMMTSPAALAGSRDTRWVAASGGYLGLLGLAAHELFHTWNVKHFRPAGLVPYNFAGENYTESLWIAEGTTSYYDELLLARTGQMEIDDYLRRVASGVGRTRNKMGSKRQSLAESSWDAWIRLFALQDHADTAESQVNFYGRGGLASLCLDLLIRDATGNDRSLDDVVRAMYKDYGWQRGGYTPEDFAEVAGDVAGEDLSWFFRDHIRGTRPLPLERALAVAGLELGFERSDEPMLGLRTRPRDGRRVVTGVDEMGPAFGLGFVSGDELVAIDGRRVGTRSPTDLLEDRRPGDEVSILYFRRDSLRETTVRLAESPYGSYFIDYREDASPEAIEVFEAWSGRAWGG
ncbi:MAG: PDZ domain-containing protein [Planctomycetota bacterium]